jgi:Family of unknown function (DUF6527)
MKHSALTHQFVDYIPADPAEGTLYVSLTYNTAVHRCACGCGNKVATPITPADWQLSYNGETISLTPSIGNWGFPCRSHYWIDAGRIRWSGPWTPGQIAAGRAHDDHGRARYFAQRASGTSSAPAPAGDRRARASWFLRLRAILAKPSRHRPSPADEASYPSHQGTPRGHE